MSTDSAEFQKIVASLLFASDRSLSRQDLQTLIEKVTQTRPETEQIEQALSTISETVATLAIDLQQTASGYRLQTRREYADYVAALWQERAPRYSKAILETLALIAYRQPITRGEIEHIRGVSVSSHIVKTLLERKWVRILGHREVPGRPALYGTTREFLDYFNLKSLNELPSLPELKSIEELDQTVQQLIEKTPQNTGETTGQPKQTDTADSGLLH